MRAFGYQHIKTFGQGRDVPVADWHAYIEQLIHQGLFEVAPDQRNALRITPASEEVLFHARTVELVKINRRNTREAQPAAPALAKTKGSGKNAALFERLRKLRLRLAREMGKPPYIIFGDTTPRGDVGDAAHRHRHHETHQRCWRSQDARVWRRLHQGD